MTMRLADCFIEVLAYVKLSMRRPEVEYDAFRSRVLSQLDESKTLALAAGHSVVDFQNALFAVVAWIDEAVMASGWNGTQRWKKELLQQRHFGTGRAGVEFFTRLDQIAGHQQGVREVYYFCLMLGFKGKFITKSQEKTLDELKQHHVAMLVRDAQHIGVDGEAVLFPQSYPTSVEGTPPVRRTESLKTMLAVVGVPLAVLVVMYLSYDLVLGSVASGFATFLK